MRRYLIPLGLLLSLLTPEAKAANSTVGAMTAAGGFIGSELLYIVQSGADRKGTPAQMATYVYGLMTGDCTVTASAITCTKTGGVAFGTLATLTPASGIATFLGAPSSANLLAALTTKTGSGNAVFGTAPTIDSLNATTAMTLAFLTGSTQCLHVNSSGVLSGTGSDCGAGGGAVSSVTGGCGVNVTPTTGATVVSASITPRNNTSTSDTIASTDCGSLVTENNASAVAVALPQAGTTGFLTGFYSSLKNKGAGLVTITPVTSTIDGAASLTLKQGQSFDYYSDGTNYWTLPGRPTNVACADLTNAGALCSTTPGTGVAAAAANALSAAGGLSSTIASGTSALGTGAITSATCATVVTTTATNTATTDVVWWGFNGDPTAVTGYSPATAGMLTIIAYPSSGNVNFKVCNNTSSSVTPGAITLNWRIVR